MSKVYQVKRENPTAQISDAKMQPIKAPVIGLALDAKMQGNLLASEVFAALKQQHGVWVTFAHRVFAMAHDGREVFAAAVKTQTASIMSENMQTHGASKKDMGKEIRSAMVQVSKLVKIANAANKGATLAGCAKYYGADDGAHIGYNRVYAYCVAHLAATASKKGRPVNALVTKLGKWLDATVVTQAKAARDAEMIQLDAETEAALRKLIAKLAPAAE